ncbi:MAG: hypothetical protein JXQ73_09375, partial [Phycisphaerae bacterium]|nr:hypothetical protein [Phycisphaerae bacterium]
SADTPRLLMPPSCRATPAAHRCGSLSGHDMLATSIAVLIDAKAPGGIATISAALLIDAKAAAAICVILTAFLVDARTAGNVFIAAE